MSAPYDPGYDPNYDPNTGPIPPYGQQYPTPPGQIPPNQMPPGPPTGHYGQPVGETFGSHLFDMDIRRLATPAILKTTYTLVIVYAMLTAISAVVNDVSMIVTSSEYSYQYIPGYVASLLPDIARPVITMIFAKLGLELFYHLTHKK
ncbi:MAG: hypothetical protein LBR21_07870 [Propionibacteriaceae bacterium]|jgi:hypothetical protein|nr:hypothetical protein [Propionibacteriaceae bacterium]